MSIWNSKLVIYARGIDPLSLQAGGVNPPSQKKEEEAYWERRIFAKPRRQLKQ